MGLLKTGINAGIGMGLEKWGNKQQLKQAEELQKLQIQGSQAMGKFNQGLALEMWDKTGYEAQRKQMEDAGINPGLMYGSAGSGGTTQTPTGQVSGQGAEQGGSKALGILQLSQQMQMNKAQIDLMKAQENKTNIEATKTAGVDTELGKAQVTNLMQVTQNQAVQGAILEYDKQIRNIEANVAGRTQEDIIRSINAEADKVVAQAGIEKNNGKISDATYKEIIKQVKLDTTQKAEDIKQTKASTALTDNTRDLQNYQKQKVYKETEQIDMDMLLDQQANERGWSQNERDSARLQLEAMKQKMDFSKLNSEERRKWLELFIKTVKD